MNPSLSSVSRRVAVAVAVSTDAVILLPGVAGAPFPGANGTIVYQSTQQATASGCPPCTTSELFTVVPAGQLDCTGYTDQHAFVSPDGSEMIFASNRDVGSTSTQLYTMPLSTAPLGTLWKCRRTFRPGRATTIPRGHPLRPAIRTPSSSSARSRAVSHSSPPRT